MEDKLPEGFVEIEVEIDDNGNYSRKILRHGGSDSCKTQKDDQLLNDMFSELGEVDDHGRTDEYYENNKAVETRKHVESPKKKKQENKDLNTL